MHDSKNATSLLSKNAIPFYFWDNSAKNQLNVIRYDTIRYKRLTLWCSLFAT